MTSGSREWSAAARPWRVIVATSQLGYRPQSPKGVSLLLKGEGDLPDEIPFFVRPARRIEDHVQDIEDVYRSITD